MRGRAGAIQAVATILLATAASPAWSEPKTLEISQIRLTVALVHDPDLPRLEPEIATRALLLAQDEFERRFGVNPPALEIARSFSLQEFLRAFAEPSDPRCAPLYAARYRGTGESELLKHKDAALKFFERWPLESLLGFIDPSDRSKVGSHADLYAYYVKRYVRTVDAMKGLKTPAGAPLIQPERSADRSFVAWTCALLRQAEYDVVLTNAFILADLSTEPHPHAVFGKAKIGGIAAKSPARPALGGQALLATTFGIDTRLKEFQEVVGGPPTPEERAKILGTYLLAHEIAHAVFGIPDVFDHPTGCLMTSRPGATYRDGLKELEENLEPCPRCRPYVEARAALDRARRLYKEGRYQAATTSIMAAAKLLPKHFHGSRKKRMAQIMVIASKSYGELGRETQARSLAQAAFELDPSSDDAALLWRAWGTPAAAAREIPGASTASTATASGPPSKPPAP